MQSMPLGSSFEYTKQLKAALNSSATRPVCHATKTRAVPIDLSCLRIESALLFCFFLEPLHAALSSNCRHSMLFSPWQFLPVVFASGRLIAPARLSASGALRKLIRWLGDTRTRRRFLGALGRHLQLLLAFILFRLLPPTVFKTYGSAPPLQIHPWCCKDILQPQLYPIAHLSSSSFLISVKAAQY